MSQSCVTTWPIDLPYGFIMFQYTTTQPTPCSYAFMELSSTFNSFASFYYPRLYYLYSISPLFRCTNSNAYYYALQLNIIHQFSSHIICVQLPFLHSFTATFPPLYNCTLLTMWFTFDYHIQLTFFLPAFTLLHLPFLHSAFMTFL